MWIGHTLRKPPSNITKATMEWNPRKTRKKGRHRTTWRLAVIIELKPEKESWAEVKALAANGTRWRTFTRALFSTEE
jgi:hypothetical protein